MPSAASTLWTVERANRALPLVRRIVDDLVRAHAEWRDIVERFTLASARNTAAVPDPEALRLQREAGRSAAEVDAFVRELAELGVECKSLDSGLVDFPSEREGRVVYLCWRQGEAQVTHWHETDAGFQGRQPL
jgi:hypothetical protein